MGCENCLTRRRFLETGIQAASAIALATPVASLLSSCGQNPLAVVTGPTSSIATDANNLATFTFANYPVLQSPGGSIHVTVVAASGSKDVFVTRVSSTTADTVSAICTHAGCELNPYNSTSHQYLCSCHGSIFSVTGSVVNGPAVNPLTSYASVVNAANIQVTIA